MKLSSHKVVPVVKQALIVIGCMGVLALFNIKNPGYIGVTAHPYLILSLILGFSLGFRNSFFISIPIALFYCGFLFLGTDALRAEAVYTTKSLSLPLLILLLPAVIGNMADRLRNEICDLTRTQTGSDQMIQNLEKVNSVLRNEKNQIEGRFVSQSQTISRVFGYAQILESTDMKEIANALVDLVCDQLDENNCYVYIFEGEDLVCQAFRDTVAEGLPQTITEAMQASFPLLVHALQTGAVTRAEHLLGRGQMVPGEHGIVAPLVESSREVVGVLMLRKLDFFKYVPSTFTTLKELAVWGGMCVARAKRMHSSWEKTYRDEITGLFSHFYLMRRLRTEFNQAKRYQLPLYAIRFEIPELVKLPALERIAVTKIVSDVIHSPARDVDTTAIGKEGGCFFNIMMMASKGEVEKYIGSVRDSFRKMQRSLGGWNHLKLQCYVLESNNKQKGVDDFLASEAIYP